MSTTAPRRTLLDRWIPALLMIAGSLAFLGGGRHHPHIAHDTSAPLGSEAFWRHFAQVVLDRPSWSAFHALILAGPVLWALAGAGAVRALPRQVRALGEVARGALLIGATLWAFEFVLDGYLAVRYATMIQMAEPSAAALPLALFGANAFTMARLGTVSLALFGLALLAFGLAAVSGWRARRATAIVGALGIPLGLWPIIATLRGNFWPGPFTNPLWTPLALALGLWFLLFGATLVPPDRDGAIAA